MENSYLLKLFVAGNNPKTKIIHEGLVRTLQNFGSESYDLEVINVLDKPEVANDFGVFATPTLLKKMPEPVRRVVGKMDSDESFLMVIQLIQQ